MTKRFAVRPFLAACSLLLAACPVAGMHQPAVVLRLDAAPQSVVQGDSLHLLAAVTNPGSDTLRLEFDGDCVVSFYVRADADQSLVEPAGGEPPRCDGAARTLVLAPGAAERVRHAWVARAPGGTGAFTAYAILGEHHLRRGGERDFKSAHRSNEVPVQVRPR